MFALYRKDINMGKNYNRQYQQNRNKNTISDFKQKKDKKNNITNRMKPQILKYLTVYDKTFEIEDTTETFMLALQIQKLSNEMQDENGDTIEFFDCIQEFLHEVLGEKQYQEFIDLRLSFENTMIFFSELMSVVFTDELSEQTITDAAKKNNLMKQ